MVRSILLSLFVLFFAVSVFADDLPDAPVPKVESKVLPVAPERSFWVAPQHLDHVVQFLAGTDLSAAVWDVRYTQSCLQANTCHENDPLAKPFVHNAGLSYGLAVGESYGLSLVGQRLRHSRTWVRHVWWLPQAAAIGLHSYALRNSYTH